MGDEVGVEIAAGEADHLQRVGREIAGAAAQDVSVTTVRTYRSAACAPGTHAGGNWCHGSLVGRVQVVAEGVPTQTLSVAAFSVVLHRVAVGIPTRVQQPARGVRHHVAGIIVCQLELAVGVQSGDAVERQRVCYGRDAAQLVAVVCAGQFVKCAEGLNAVEVADGVNNAVAHDIGRIAA